MAVIEYFYSAHSAYAYIGSKLLQDIAVKAGATIDHRPMDLRKVVAVTGPGSTNHLTPQRFAYFSGREIMRWAEARGVEIVTGMPTHHDNEIALSNGVLIAGLHAGVDINPLAHRFLEAHWRDDADLDDANTLADLIEQVGLGAGPLLAAATSPEVKADYDRNTAESIERSVFGSPTYFVDGDMFYGQDHLELVARALEEPFFGTWPPSEDT